MNLDELMGVLADCLCTQLEQTGAGSTCWCGVYPGAQVSWEHCEACGEDKCGMGYVRLVSVYPTTMFPEPAPRTETCRSLKAAQFEVGALRCMPTMEEDGSLPTPADLLDVTLSVVYDMEAMQAAIECCFADNRTDYRLGLYIPTGPSGGCVGGYWEVFAEIGT